MPFRHQVSIRRRGNGEIPQICHVRPQTRRDHNDPLRIALPDYRYQPLINLVKTFRLVLQSIGHFDDKIKGQQERFIPKML